MKILTESGWKPLDEAKEKTLEYAYNSGTEAYEDGIPHNKNPHPRGSRLAKAWLEGHKEAKYDDLKWVKRQTNEDANFTVEDFAELMDVDVEELMGLSEEAYDDITNEFIEQLDEDVSRAQLHTSAQLKAKLAASTNKKGEPYDPKKLTKERIKLLRARHAAWMRPK